MRERADRYPVDTGLRDRTYGIEIHATRGFGNRSAGNELHALLHLRGGHVVEHDDVGPRLERRLHLFDAFALVFHLGTGRREVAGTTHGEPNVAVHGREVVVLDQHRSREIEPMVRATTGAHGVLL